MMTTISAPTSPPTREKAPNAIRKMKIFATTVLHTGGSAVASLSHRWMPRAGR